MVECTEESQEGVGALLQTGMQEEGKGVFHPSNSHSILTIQTVT